MTEQLKEPRFSPDDLRRMKVIGRSVVAAVVLIAGVWLAKPAYRHIKLWRALQLADQAVALSKNPDTAFDAINKAQSAYNLAPWDVRLVRTQARIYASLEPSMAVPFWELAVKTGNGVKEDRFNLAATALAVGEIAIASDQIEWLRENAKSDPETYELGARLLVNQDRLSDAIATTRSALDAPEAPSKVHMLYVQLCQMSPHEADREAGLAYLWQLTEKNDTLALLALKNLSQHPDISNEEIRQLIEKLRWHPKLKAEDRLLILELQLKLPETVRSEIVEEATKLFNPNDDQTLIKLGRWLNRQKLSDFTLKVIELKKALRRKDLFLLLVDALAMAKEWEQIQVILDEPLLPVEDYVVYLFRMRVFLEQNQHRRAELQWERAMLAAKTYPKKLWYLSDYASLMGLTGYTRSALEELVAIPSSMRNGYMALLQLEQKFTNTRRIRDVLSRMNKAFQGEATIENDLAYTNLLLEEQIMDSVEVARKIVERRPAYLAHRITLALGYLRIDEPESALALFDELELNWMSLQPRWRVVLALTLRLNDHSEQSRLLIQNINENQLLPQEVKLLHLVQAP